MRASVAGHSEVVGQLLDKGTDVGMWVKLSIGSVLHRAEAQDKGADVHAQDFLLLLSLFPLLFPTWLPEILRSPPGPQLQTHLRHALPQPVQQLLPPLFGVCLGTRRGHSATHRLLHTRLFHARAHVTA